jgi:S1-C subfamily serine protease
MRTTVAAIAVSAAIAGTNAAAQPAVERIAYDYTALYHALNPSIVKIHSDSGTGSGFLVTTEGLIATNHHVVRNSRYLAAEFADGRKVIADLVVLDPKHDLAILRVNRAIVQGIRPLPLLPPERDVTVSAGIPVIAFGSPLSQTFLMTQGIVSKVEPGVLLGDFLIQHGNSGGPLVSLAGDVIGVNTFAEGNISGAVRVNVLRAVLARPDVAGYAGAEPDASLLPVADRERYPADRLKERIVREPLDVSAYHLDGGKFTITAITPVLVGKSQFRGDLQQAANRYARRAKKIKDENYDPVDEPFYDWMRNATSRMDSVSRS